MKYSDYEYTFEGNVHATFLKGASDETVISWLKENSKNENPLYGFREHYEPIWASSSIKLKLAVAKYGTDRKTLIGLLKSKEEPLIKAAVLRNPNIGNAINRWRGFESKEIID